MTTSVRLPADLRRRLDAYSRRHRVGRNRVIAEAIRSYLRDSETEALHEEARRQSLLAGFVDSGADWERVAETDPWPNL